MVKLYWFRSASCSQDQDSYWNFQILDHSFHFPKKNKECLCCLSRPVQIFCYYVHISPSKAPIPPLNPQLLASNEPFSLTLTLTRSDLKAVVFYILLTPLKLIHAVISFLGSYHTSLPTIKPISLLRRLQPRIYFTYSSMKVSNSKTIFVASPNDYSYLVEWTWERNGRLSW